MEHNDAVSVLSALAHGHRLAIFRMLVVRGTSGALAGEIAREIGIGATAASFHLKELVGARIVHATRQGRNIRYALHVENVRRLLTFLTEDCCKGQPELICGVFAAPLSTFDSCSPGCAPAAAAEPRTVTRQRKPKVAAQSNVKNGSKSK